ncbi:LacI family DNA-binding transcriptional regulator [Streptomyces hawaiiensis]|uniref:hypothetical protein n=1 Tax=Streptomyces hawaiiensis TaxID=67305 RepID=UPI003651C992
MSRAPAGNCPVPEETRARITAAVDSLHDVVNVHAKALSGRAPGPIALVIRDITGPTPAHVAAGVDEGAGSRGRLSPVCSTRGGTDREDDLVQLTRDSTPRGRPGRRGGAGRRVPPADGRLRPDPGHRRARLVLVGRPPLHRGCP